MPRIPEIIDGKTRWRDVTVPKKFGGDKRGGVITRFRFPTNEAPRLAVVQTRYTCVAQFIDKTPRPVLYKDMAKVFFREPKA